MASPSPTPRRSTRLLERIAIGVASIAVAVVLIALASGYFTSHDSASVSAGKPIVGFRYTDQGDRILRPGEARPKYASDPPTSGPHRRVPIVKQGALLTDDQILTGLAAGDVIVLYGSQQPPSGLRASLKPLSAPFTAALAQAGQAVIYGRRRGLTDIVALSWTRMLRQKQLDSEALAEFVRDRLGHGANG